MLIDRSLQKNSRTVFSKSIGDVGFSSDSASEGRVSASNDLMATSAKSKRHLSGKKMNANVTRNGEKRRPTTTGSVVTGTTRGGSPASKRGVQNTNQGKKSNTSPSTTPTKTLFSGDNQKKKKSSVSPDTLGRSLDSSSTGPSLIGRYFRAQSARTKMRIDRSNPSRGSNIATNRVPPSHTRDVKLDPSSARNQTSASKMKRGRSTKGTKEKLTEVARGLATSVPLSKYKTLSPRRASTPKSSPHRSSSTSPIDQALQDLEETVAKKLNVAVNSVTANLEGFKEQFVANSSTFKSIDSSSKNKDLRFDLNFNESKQFFDDYYNDHMASLEKLTGVKESKARDRYKSNDRKSTSPKAYKNKVDNRVHWEDIGNDHDDNNDNDNAGDDVELPPDVLGMVKASLRKHLTEKVSEIVHQLMDERGIIDSSDRSNANGVA